MSLAISIHNLRKTYKNAKQETLHGITLAIEKGEFVGLLGPNGTGKTTMINCISGITSLSEGSIHIHGHDVVKAYKEARAKVGISPQEFTIDIFQTVDEILDFQAGFFGIIGNAMKERREALLTRFDLLEHRDKKFQVLSGGLKRRTMLAKAMMHNPDVLILDEPSAGIDVETRRMLWAYLKKIHSEGKTIVLTSHYLEEIEELCDRVIIIKDGLILKDGSIEELTKERKLEETYLSLVGHIDTIESK